MKKIVTIVTIIIFTFFLHSQTTQTNHNNSFTFGKVTKVNIDTDGRLVWTRVHREFFNDHPEVFDFRKPGVIMIEEYARFIEQKSTKLMSAGKLRDMRASVS